MHALWLDECGATAAEYALILAIMGAAITVAALVLRSPVRWIARAVLSPIAPGPVEAGFR